MWLILHLDFTPRPIDNCERGPRLLTRWVLEVPRRGMRNVSRMVRVGGCWLGMSITSPRYQGSGSCLCLRHWRGNTLGMCIVHHHARQKQSAIHSSLSFPLFGYSGSEVGGCTLAWAKKKKIWIWASLFTGQFCIGIRTPQKNFQIYRSIDDSWLAISISGVFTM